MKITTTIVIHPRYLTENINEYIRESAKSKLLNVCSKEYGYVLEVVSVDKITKTSITRANADIVTVVDLTIDSMKPEVGDTITGKVCLVFGGGIMLLVRDKMKVLISADKACPYKYTQSTLSFDAEGKKSILKGGMVSAKILGVRFSQNDFNCFGELIDVVE